jgi:hypothetical protein
MSAVRGVVHTTTAVTSGGTDSLERVQRGAVPAGTDVGGPA